MSATTDEFTFRDADDVEVFGRRWIGSASPRAVVLISHGLSEHSGRYARFAEALRDAGYGVYAVDHRGHGRTASATGPGRLGPRGMDAVLDDLHELSTRATAEHGSLPVVLFGHSLGALIAQMYAERYGDGLTALILSGSPGAADELHDMAAGIQAAVDAGLADEPVPALDVFNESFQPARTKFDWLSRDPAEVDAYLADPMCGDKMPATYGLIAETMRAASDAMEPEGIARVPAGLPVLLVTGERDVASNDAANVRVLEARLRARGLDVDARYYAEGRHELLNDVNRDEVTADIIGWLDARV